MADKQSDEGSSGETTDAGSSRSQVSEGSATEGPGISAVVGVGASAGGLEALEELFSNLSADTGMAFIVVTHLHPGRKSLLPELLAERTELSVVAIAEGMEIAADHVYIGPPGAQLSIEGGKLRLLNVSQHHAPKNPIDHFFRSLAHDQQERAIAVILSGTGSDGSLGLQAIKAEGGMVIAESPERARHTGMPESAIGTGLVDFIDSPAEMPTRIVKYLSAPNQGPDDEGTEAQSIAREPVQDILNLLHSSTGHDFSAYKLNTIHRRIARRMNVHQITTNVQYLRYLRENREEIDILFREILINVTNYFRDADAWEAMQQHIAGLLKSHPDDQTIRVWVPGCSTGEEVYSIAMILYEYLEGSQRRVDVQIFGTDLDIDAVETARSGIYSGAIAENLTPQRLEKFFTADESGYRINKRIREMVIFAQQNVIKDPPFTRMHIVSCRNLLIYLNAAIQNKLLPIFHYALKPGGLLFLGSSENIGSFKDLFAPLDKRWKIFQRKETHTDRSGTPLFPVQALHHTAANARPAIERRDSRVITQRQIERLLMVRFVPASVIVEPGGDIVYLHGRTGEYLEPTEGQPRNNILEMARKGLQLELAEALRQCVEEGQDFERRRISIDRGDDKVFVDLVVTRFEKSANLQDLLLVSFHPGAPELEVTNVTRATGISQTEEDAHIEQLERELRLLRISHQAIVDELEISNEELQSTNEELQSANEELETSKEEMQSLNEELTTVNAELQANIEDLMQANDDMQNLLNSTKIATVFLDSDLQIKRYTEQARELIMMRPSDVGRPISELASKLQTASITEDCREVLNTLVFREAEVEANSGAIYMMRILPYRTARNAIEGVVLTFVDISRLKHAQRSLRHMSEVFQEGVDPIFIVDLQGNLLDINDSALEEFGYTREELIGNPVQRLVPLKQQDKTSDLFVRCRDGETVRNVAWTLLNRSGDELRVALTLSVLTTAEETVDAIAMIVLAANDRERDNALA